MYLFCITKQKEKTAVYVRYFFNCRNTNKKEGKTSLETTLYAHILVRNLNGSIIWRAVIKMLNGVCSGQQLTWVHFPYWSEQIWCKLSPTSQWVVPCPLGLGIQVEPCQEKTATKHNTCCYPLKGPEVNFLVKGVFSLISPCLGNICSLSFALPCC